MPDSKLLLLPVVALIAAAGCSKPKDREVKVDGILLPQALAVIEAEPGPTLHVPGDDLTTLPEGPVVRLAIARTVPWREVDALIRRVEAAGKRPVLLVGKRHHVRAFVLTEELTGKESIALTATSDYKACVSPPGVEEAKCVQPIDPKYIDVAHTRKLVREAMRKYHLTDVDVEVPADLGWVDVVRIIDGARTCCQGTAMRVRLNR